MKRLTIFFLVILTACKPYHISSIVKEIPMAAFSNLDEAYYKINSLNDLPRKIRNIPEYKYQAITTDTSHFNSKKGSTSLFVSGAYDKKAKSGYIIQSFNGLEKFNQCTLFQIQDTVLICNFYSFPTNINTWQDAKSYLKWPKDRLFSGGTAIFKSEYYKVKK